MTQDEEQGSSADEGEGRFVLLTRARNAVDASILAAQLEDGGVPVQQVGGMAAIGFGDLPSDALLIEIWIPDSHLDEGRRIFQEFDQRKKG